MSTLQRIGNPELYLCPSCDEQQSSLTKSKPRFECKICGNKNLVMAVKDCPCYDCAKKEQKCQRCNVHYVRQ